MNYQDRTKPVTAEDLIRRYDFESLESNKKAITVLRDGLTKTNTELEDFVVNTAKSIQELQDQVDGELTTWFFPNPPTLENEPAMNWTTQEEKTKHLGDLYYDTDTGYSYRFMSEGDSFKWLRISDSDVAEALAIARTAKDTADSKRRVFVTQPFTPYDVGDVWWNNGVLYRCRASRSEGDFNSNDFIDDLKYTDDTLALETQAQLDSYKEKVENEYATKASLETTSENITANVTSQLTQFATNEVVKTLQKQVTQIQTDSYTKTEINAKLTDGSVTKVSTTSATFDENGMHYEKTGSKASSTINQIGIKVNDIDTKNELLFAGYDEEEKKSVVRTENLEVKKYFVIGNKGRFEPYEEGVALFTL